MDIKSNKSLGFPDPDNLPLNPSRKQMEEYAKLLIEEDAERFLTFIRDRRPFERPKSYGFRMGLVAAITKLKRKGYQFPKKSAAFK